jgi:hypothetical protein
VRRETPERRNVIWKYFSKGLKLLGGVWYVGLFSVHLYLIFHWRAVRPYSPNPSLGWTVQLPWCLGAYGSPQEAHLLNALFSWLTVPFMMIMASLAIDYYKFGIMPFRTPPRIQK